MSLARTVLLGFLAGATITLGLPLGRLRAPAARLRAMLSALAVGILTFLLIDVFSHALDPIGAALAAVRTGRGGWAEPVRSGAALAVGTAVGVLALAGYQRATRRRAGPGADGPSLAPARLSATIAAGIGLHNLAEGLAIGAAARSGQLTLSSVLVIGFALHNATEGFGIVSPLAGAAQRPSWAFLGAMAAIGGGPTTLGTLLGWAGTSPTLSVLFLSLAGGSILFVVVQLLFVAARSPHPTTVYLGVTAGLLAGFATDLVVTYAGA